MPISSMCSPPALFAKHSCLGGRPSSRGRQLPPATGHGLLPNLLLDLHLVATSLCRAAVLLVAVFAPCHALGQTVVSPPGVYTVETTGPTKITFSVHGVAFSWDDIAPSPTPGPTPTPVPVPPAPPTPPEPALTGKIFLTYWYDHDKEDQLSAKLREDLVRVNWRDPQFNANLQAIDVKQVDPNTNVFELDKLNHRSEIASATLPLIVVQEQVNPTDKTAHVIKPSLAPKSVDDVKAAVLKLRGK